MPRATVGGIAACLTMLLVTIGHPHAVSSRTPPEAARALPVEHRATLDRYCVSCHNPRTKSGQVALDSSSLPAIGGNEVLWEKVIRKVRSGLMPPVGRPRPDQSVAAGLVSWLETEIDRIAASSPNPGRTAPFHRLNRAEYRNAVRELLALEVDPAALLPSDDASYGFDNIAGVLKVNASGMEQYLSAARKISRAALGTAPDRPAAHIVRIADEVPQYAHVEGLPFGTRGGVLVRHDFPQDADYLIKVELMCRIPGQCDGGAGFADRHELEISLDGERLKVFAIEPHENEIRREGRIVVDALEVRVRVEAGVRNVGVAFLRRSAAEEVEAKRHRLLRPLFLNGDNLVLQEHSIYQPFVDTVTITGPFDATGPGNRASRSRIFVCQPRSATDTACVSRIVSTLARRAFRRPVSNDEVKGLLRFYQSGVAEGGVEAGIDMVLRRILVSPEFLVRIERDPANAAAESVYPLSDVELASRLSFFLWSGPPDDQLLEDASRKRLKAPGVLDRHLGRMLADDRANALVSNFAGQWLQLRNLDAVVPSAQLYPDFDGLLRTSFRRETELLFRSVLLRGSVLELLNADYSFLNERLARHYGIRGVYGSRFRRVTLPDGNRRGLLGHGSVLTVTSRPNRTSPVLRGKWILENILGVTPPPPPANVPPLGEAAAGARVVASMRERMAQHRENPACSGCHAAIDPSGLALEQFDAVGRWRSVDDAFQPIDTSGALPDGTNFSSLAEFRLAITRKPEMFAGTVTEKMLTYALGRGVEYYDMPAVRKIVRDAEAGGYELSALVAGIVKSVPFQMRKAEGPR